MNIDRLLSTLFRILFRPVTDLVINLLVGRGKAPSEMTKAERAQVRTARKAVTQARRAARITRRLR